MARTWFKYKDPKTGEIKSASSANQQEANDFLKGKTQVGDFANSYEGLTTGLQSNMPVIHQEPTGTYVPDPSYLKYYKESEIIRQPDGKIYLKPGIPVKWTTQSEVPKTPTTPVTPTEDTQYGEYVSDPAYLKYYKESEIIRSLDGKIYLKPGIEVRWEETKTKEGEGETPEEKKEREKQEADDAQKKQDEYLKKAYATLDQALKEGRLTLDEYQLFKSVVQYYPPGIEVDPTEILNTFKKISETTIDPHFAELTKVAQTSLQQNLDYLEKQRQLETQTEQMKEQQAIEDTKKNLEASGMTFSGQGVEQLGGESAFGEQGSNAAPQIYGQMPLGQVQKTNQLLQSSSLAQYNQQVLEQARGGEAKLGTTGMSGISVPGGYDALGGITGTLPTEQETAKGTYLQNLITQAGNRSAYNQNLSLNVPSYNYPSL